MMTTDDHLRFHLEPLQNTTEAEAVSLCLPAASGGAEGLREAEVRTGPSPEPRPGTDRAHRSSMAANMKRRHVFEFDCAYIEGFLYRSVPLP